MHKCPDRLEAVFQNYPSNVRFFISNLPKNLPPNIIRYFFQVDKFCLNICEQGIGNSMVLIANILQLGQVSRDK